MSRGRQENRLYLVVGENPLAEEIEVLGQATQDPVAVIVRALGRSRAKTLALDHLSLPEPRRPRCRPWTCAPASTWRRPCSSTGPA